MARYSAFDVDSTELRAASFSGSGRGLKISAFAVLPCAPCAPADAAAPESAPSSGLAAALKDALKQHGIGRGEALASMDAAGAVIREFAVPFAKPDQVRKTIKFQAESHYHSAAIDELLIEFEPIGATPQSTTVWCAAIRKTAMGGLLTAFREAGMSPGAVELNVNSLFTTLTHYREVVGHDKEDGSGVEAKAFLAIEIGRTHARVILGRGKTMLDGRSFRIELPPEGAPLPETAISKIVREVQRTVFAQNTGSGLGRVYLSGAATEDVTAAALAEALAPAFVEILDLGKIVDIRLEKEAADRFRRFGAAATGLALKGGGIDPMGFNFRKEEFRYERKFDTIKRGLACTMCLVFIALFLMAYNYRLKAGNIEREYDIVVNDFQKKWFDRVTPGEPPGPGMPLERLRAAMQRRQGETGLPPLVSALDYVKDFSDQLVRANKPVVWEQGNFDSDVCTVILLLGSQTDGSKIYETVLAYSQYLIPDNPRYAVREKGIPGKNVTMTMKMRTKGTEDGK
jgi:hypothetical protein